MSKRHGDDSTPRSRPPIKPDVYWKLKVYFYFLFFIYHGRHEGRRGFSGFWILRIGKVKQGVVLHNRRVGAGQSHFIFIAAHDKGKGRCECKPVKSDDCPE